MSAVDTIIGVTGAIGALGAAVTVAVGAFRGGHSAQIVNNATATADSWKERSASQDAAIEGLHQKIQEKTDQITALQTRISVLSDMVTGRVAIEQLTREFREFVEQRERATIAYTAKVDARLQETLDQVNAIRTDVHGNAEKIMSVADRISRMRIQPRRGNGR